MAAWLALWLFQAWGGAAWAVCGSPKSIPMTEQDVKTALEKLVTASGAAFQIELEWAPALQDLTKSPASAMGPNMAPNTNPYAVVWVSSTLLDEVSSPLEVAYVLAHETVHLVQGHMQKMDEFLQKAYETYKPKITPSDPNAPKPPDRWDQLSDDEFQKFNDSIKDVRNQAQKALERQADSEGLTLYNNAFPGADPDAPGCALQHLGEFDDTIAALTLSKVKVSPNHDPLPDRARKVRAWVAAMK